MKPPAEEVEPTSGGEEEPPAATPRKKKIVTVEEGLDESSEEDGDLSGEDEDLDDREVDGVSAAGSQGSYSNYVDCSLSTRDGLMYCKVGADFCRCSKSMLTGEKPSEKFQAVCLNRMDECTVHRKENPFRHPTGHYLMRKNHDVLPSYRTDDQYAVKQDEDQGKTMATFEEKEDDILEEDEENQEGLLATTMRTMRRRTNGKAPMPSTMPSTNASRRATRRSLRPASVPVLMGRSVNPSSAG